MAPVGTPSCFKSQGLPDLTAFAAPGRWPVSECEITSHAQDFEQFSASTWDVGEVCSAFFHTWQVHGKIISKCFLYIDVIGIYVNYMVSPVYIALSREALKPGRSNSSLQNRQTLHHPGSSANQQPTWKYTRPVVCLQSDCLLIYFGKSVNQLRVVHI